MRNTLENNSSQAPRGGRTGRLQAAGQPEVYHCKEKIPQLHLFPQEKDTQVRGFKGTWTDTDELLKEATEMIFNGLLCLYL